MALRPNLFVTVDRNTLYLNIDVHIIITFWRLCKCDILVNLTGKQIHLPTILVSIESIRSRLLDTRGGGAW